MMKTIFSSLLFFGVLLVICCGPKKPQDKDVLLPGEVRDPMYPVPIVLAITDTSCSDSVRCPSKASDCVTQNFTPTKDTLYYLTVSYFNGDTLNASCRACGTIYKGNAAVETIVTACPTGGPWVGFAELKKDSTYTLSLCLQRCPALQNCNCGQNARADAAVSMRRIW